MGVSINGSYCTSLSWEIITDNKKALKIFSSFSLFLFSMGYNIYALCEGKGPLVGISVHKRMNADSAYYVHIMYVYPGKMLFGVK